MRRLFPCCALVALVTLLPWRKAPPATTHASSAIPLDIEELVAVADLVIEARVRDLRSLRSTSGRIDTEYTLEVGRTFWGGERSERVLRLPGGVLPDGSGMLLPGVPSFLLGEELVLALSAPDLEGLRMPVGLDQGCYRLRVEEGGERVAWRGPAGSATIDPASGRLRCGGAAFGIPYAELVARMTAAATARRAGLIGPAESQR